MQFHPQLHHGQAASTIHRNLAGVAITPFWKAMQRRDIARTTQRKTMGESGEAALKKTESTGEE